MEKPSMLTFLECITLLLGTVVFSVCGYTYWNDKTPLGVVLSGMGVGMCLYQLTLRLGQYRRP